MGVSFGLIQKALKDQDAWILNSLRSAGWIILMVRYVLRLFLEGIPVQNDPFHPLFLHSESNVQVKTREVDTNNSPLSKGVPRSGEGCVVQNNDDIMMRVAERCKPVGVKLKFEGATGDDRNGQVVIPHLMRNPVQQEALLN